MMPFFNGLQATRLEAQDLDTTSIVLLMALGQLLLPQLATCFFTQTAILEHLVNYTNTLSYQKTTLVKGQAATRHQ